MRPAWWVLIWQASRIQDPRGGPRRTGAVASLKPRQRLVPERILQASFKGCTKCMGKFFVVYKGEAKAKAKIKSMAKL